MNADARFITLATLSLRHDYFAPGRPARLSLQADEASSALMSRFGLRLCQDGVHHSVLCRESQREGLWSERNDWPDGGLVFTVHSADPASPYYTAADCDGEMGRFRPTADGNWERQPASARPVRPLGALAELVLPLARAECTDVADWHDATVQQYAMTLPARQTIWKYVFLGQWKHDLRVVDTAGDQHFEDPVSEPLPGGKEARVIRSVGSIALQERPQQRFALLRHGATGERIVIGRLPMATPGALMREIRHGVPCEVSEIFINC